MSSIFDTLVKDDPPGKVLVVGRVSKADGTTVSAVVPSFNLTHEFGPMPYAHAADVAVGDAVLLGFDEQGTSWVVGWSGVASGGGGGPDDDSAYLTIADAATTYETITDAASTYETIAHASSTYETSAHAAATYETSAHAASTYETATHAAATYAPLASPALTGSPTAPTPGAGNNSTRIATTQYVQGELGSYETTAHAAATYETATHAAATYETATHAAATYAPLASPALTGNPTAPTQAVDNSSTRIATTAFVLGQASAAGDGTPAMDGSAARGTSTHFARADHVHPTDTSLLSTAAAAATYAPLASPALTGNPTAPTPATGDNDTSIATTAFVQAALAVGVPPTQTVLTTGSGTYTTPARVSAILVECVAGGASGGGVSVGSSGQVAVGGGGGGGAYSRKFIRNPAATYAYAVGTGGAAPAAGANNGNDGTDTTFGATIVVAKAGVHGNGAASSATAQVTTGGAGGAASGGTGDVLVDGGAGGDGIATSAANGAGGNGGAGAVFGAERIGPVSLASGGSIGLSYGGGGSGAVRTSSTGTHAGGAGHDGIIIITEFYGDATSGGYIGKPPTQTVYSSGSGTYTTPGLRPAGSCATGRPSRVSLIRACSR
jgi:hypothetical protein